MEATINMDNVVIETEEQRRGQAFQQARQQLEREYNCRVVIAPKWEPGVHGTFVLSFDEQVMVGPAPAGGPAPEQQEEETE